jgi:hypothetical protein
MFPRNYDSALRFRVDGEVHIWELNRLLINESNIRGWQAYRVFKLLEKT